MAKANQFTAGGYHNLQTQANSQAKSVTVKKTAPRSGATVLVLGGSEPPAAPDEVRDTFRDSYELEGAAIKPK
ncbi:hypothetical protein B0T24DRAFT_721031 [Lasiosphaeria ovina]|uniref:Uncharacterized protein n=1 Tax=Lasiosphaeria ovina TaxID=92902 RepID=A0AAE0K702_9PEZI|nr:hypothetical protein B0T24DRAFT_721031 [Lasiosphaeria ovina]